METTGWRHRLDGDRADQGWGALFGGFLPARPAQKSSEEERREAALHHAATVVQRM